MNKNIRVIVAGSRGLNDYKIVKKYLDKIFGRWNKEITIISGGARGADKLGEKYARENGLKVRVYKADWEKYGKRAGYIRNEKMAEVGDILIAFWDGESRGTKNMIDIMRKNGKKVIIIRYK